MDKLRKKILTASYKAGACHIGSALSCIDIIKDIHQKMRKRDIFIFGKASGVAAYYCYKYPLKKATKLLKRYPLPSNKAGLPWSGGSLGMGLSVACGMAFANRRRDVFILLGDGDFQEGQTYEALLFKNQHKLDNLKIFYDCNGLQAMGKVSDILCVPHWFLEAMGVRIIKTKKGEGVKFLEDMGYKNHYYNIDETRFAQALRELAD